MSFMNFYLFELTLFLNVFRGSIFINELIKVHFTKRNFSKFSGI